MSSIQDSFLSGANIDFIEALYARFLEDPAQVDPSWRELFERQRGQGRPIYVNGDGADGQAARAQDVPAPPTALPAADRASMELQSKVAQAVYAFRLRGHLLAQLDPLGRPRPALENVADLVLIDEHHFSSAELDQEVDAFEVFPTRRVRLRELMDRLRQTYCGHIGVEFMKLLDSERRRWLTPRMEHSGNRVEPGVEEQRRILTRLAYAQTFENFLHTKFIGKKRFSLDGGESLVPMIDTLLDVGGRLGMKELVIGMAHRGRLNVLTNVLGKRPDQIFSEFEGPKDPKNFLRRGDVKYHLGFSSDYQTPSGHTIHLSLAFNPSHLEAVNTVVEGRVRAKQDRTHDREKRRVVPLLIHGDAAFAGQGVVAETLNLARLPGYTTGGTIHLVINNQIGFTTDPEQTRSNIYATLLAHMLDIPVFHVNGDDPEACVHVMKLATEYRQTFNSDVVVDLVCYRRYGHNEGDEPAFTQPLMYQRISKHPNIAQLYAEDLVRRGRVSRQEADAIRQKCLDEFTEALARARSDNLLKEPSALEGLWKSFRGGPDRETALPETGLAPERPKELLTRLATVPEGFRAKRPQLVNYLEQRKKMARGEQPLDWAAAEWLAYGSLLTEGHPVRLTGQDVERGTFSHRHAVWHDVESGARYVPFEHLGEGQAPFRIFNSPLSEFGCLGFEYGYSLDCPDALVVWEAQFGDFANGAQVIIDQFIAAAEVKWKRLSGLTLLLPHGYEGQGPEHSSARLERFLQLCAEDNLQVCYPTTPAQIFHLLRRQVLRPWRKPLVVMSPKSLLRRSAATSALTEFTQGRFHRLLRERAEIEPAQVRRLLLCSGKVYYDLAHARDERKDGSIAIVRLEQLYPFPDEELVELFSTYPALEEIYWVQEEPQNMGAWSFLYPRLEDLASSLTHVPMVGYIGRVEAASPATGFEKAHELEQQLIVDQAMARGIHNVG
jgi:2-oxoglutarate dehydrogenase E1 component